MANELDDLYGMVTSSAEDRATIQRILDSNPVAKERAESQAALFAALATGDNAAIASAQTRFAAANNVVPPAAAATQPVAAASATLDELTRMVSKQVQTELTSGGYVKKADAEALAAAKAEELFKARQVEILQSAAQTSDQIYQIRRSHEKEFGTELDTNKFTEFLNANPGKFASLAAAHDSYVGEERVQAQIKKGIDDYKAANQSSTNLPGTSLIDSKSTVTPLPGMMRANELRINPNAAANGESARGTALDAAVKAWRQTASGGNSAAN